MSDVNDDEILKHAEAMYAKATEEARKWHGVICAIRGIPDVGEGRVPRRGRFHWEPAIELARQYLTTHGSAGSAREIEDWIGTQGLEVPRGGLRKFLWAAEGIEFDGAKGGWHFVTNKPAMQLAPK